MKFLCCCLLIIIWKKIDNKLSQITEKKSWKSIPKIFPRQLINIIHVLEIHIRKTHKWTLCFFLHFVTQNEEHNNFHISIGNELKVLHGKCGADNRFKKEWQSDGKVYVGTWWCQWCWKDSWKSWWESFIHFRRARPNIELK